MRIGLASVPVVTGDVEHNVLAMVNAMEQNWGACDLLVFGESVLQGFECLTWDYEKDCHIAVEQEDLPVRQMRQAAQRLGMAVSFGYVERVNDRLFSSQIVIDENGNIVHNFHRVSQGWKAYWHTDHHYCEGERFETFLYGGIKFAIALCGDLWTETRPEEMKRCKPDVVLWPVWCDFPKGGMESDRKVRVCPTSSTQWRLCALRQSLLCRHPCKGWCHWWCSLVSTWRHHCRAASGKTGSADYINGVKQRNGTVAGGYSNNGEPPAFSFFPCNFSRINIQCYLQ